MSMQITISPEIDKLLLELSSYIQNILEKNFVGLYVYGSLVTGDFDINLSDIDLLCVVQDDINHDEFGRLKTMHAEFVKKYREWEDRIEVQYLSKEGLKTFKTKPSKMANISPGEPFHIIEAGKDWMVNWYIVQEKAIILYGPSPKAIIDYISKEEFIEDIYEHAIAWRKRIKHISRRKGAQAYAILTLCRAFYALKHGEQVSKKKAAEWMQKEYPEWAPLIHKAQIWRQEQWENKEVDEKSYPVTVKSIFPVVLPQGQRWESLKTEAVFNYHTKYDRKGMALCV